MSIDVLQNSNKAVIDGADLGVSQTSSFIELRMATGYAAQIYWSGGTSTAGNVIVEATNDDPNSSTSPVYTVLSTDAVSTTSGSLMKSDAGAMYSYIQVRWVRSAGSGGTITVKVSTKRT